MTTKRDSFVQEIQSIRSELHRLLAGMDYCLDWKPDAEEWCAREIAFHLVDTPEGGMHSSIRQTLDSSSTELALHSSRTNMTPERQQKDLSAIQEELDAVLSGMEAVLDSTNDAEMAEKTVLAHSMRANAVVPWPAEDLIERVLINHWREHLGQLGELRDALGVE